MTDHSSWPNSAALTFRYLRYWLKPYPSSRPGVAAAAVGARRKRAAAEPCSCLKTGLESIVLAEREDAGDEVQRGETAVPA